MTSGIQRGRDPRLIPVTSLRRFYQLLRKLQKWTFQLEAAKECERNPRALQALIAESSVHIGLYENHEPFRPRPGTISEASAKSTHEARRLLSLIGRKGFSVDGLRWTFVDYEVSPIRTTKSRFEDGRPGKGSGGGIDALLVEDGQDRKRVPVVAEVKAATDRNLFLAFIQSLMLAVELSPRHQRNRLRASYEAAKFDIPDEGPFVDVALMTAKSCQGSKHPQFLAPVERLVQKLSGEPPFSSIVRRVYCFCLDFNEEGLSSPEKVFSIGSS